MHHSIILLLTFLFCFEISPAQNNYSVNFQATIRDSDGEPMLARAISLKFNIRSGSESGPVEYEETFNTNTSETGIVNIILGSGDTSDDFSSIDWASADYFLEILLDENGGTTYISMGTSQFLSVPYAFVSNTITIDKVNDADSVSTNELNTSVELNGSELRVTDADSTLSVDLAPILELPKDTDTTNELNYSLNLNGTVLELTDAGGTLTTDLSAIQDGTEDDDADPSNEIQNISREGTSVTLSHEGGGYIDAVNPYIAGEGITIENNVINSMGEDCDLNIGDIHAGGIIFYIDPTGCHGLVCAENDQSDGIRWDNNIGNYFTRARGTDYYTGALNTELIILKYGTESADTSFRHYAAYICDTLTLNGFNDWYLPAIDELLQMYAYMRLNGLGNFNSNEYWSSTENNAFSTWVIRFSTGLRSFKGRYSNFHVRAIRAF